MSVNEFIEKVADGTLKEIDIISFCSNYNKDIVELLAFDMWAYSVSLQEPKTSNKRKDEAVQQQKDKDDKLDYSALLREPSTPNNTRAIERIDEALQLMEKHFGFTLFSNPQSEQAPPEPQQQQTTDAQSLNTEPKQAPPEPQQESKGPTASTIPTINDTDKEKLVFGNALQKQYMTLNNGCYKWTLTKSLLAYMCGRLFCGDKIKEDDSDYSKEYKKGNTQMPAQEVKALFGGVDVASNRYSIKAPPRNFWKVDALFKNNGASR